MAFAHKLKMVLEEKGLLQKDLSDKTGLTETTISRYINGSRTPNIENLYLICDALDIKADWLLGLI